MRQILYREAIREALIEEMERDPSVYLMGEEVAEYQGTFRVTEGLLERFGPKRVVDTPISEEGFTGMAVGAAMTGLRPVIEYMTINFSLPAFDQIINHAAKMYYKFASLVRGLKRDDDYEVDEEKRIVAPLEPGIETVSYTHLTLPTIYSV